MVTVVLSPSDEGGLNSSLVGFTEMGWVLGFIVVVVVEVVVVVVFVVTALFPAQISFQ